MKKLLPLIFLFLMSCSGNKLAKLIETYLSTTDGVYSDLKFKAIKLNEGKPITVVDSMLYLYYDKMPVKYFSVGDFFQVMLLNDDGKQVETIFKKSTINEMIKDYKDYQEHLRSLNFDEEILKLRTIQKYSTMPSGTILAKSYDCKYSIFNPTLQVMQTMTRTFYFDKSLTRVVSASNVKQ